LWIIKSLCVNPAEAIKFECEEKVGMLNGVQREFHTGVAYAQETEGHERRNPPCFERPQRVITAWERLMVSGRCKIWRGMSWPCIHAHHIEDSKLSVPGLPVESGACGARQVPAH
jgi:hypothetical protein